MLYHWIIGMKEQFKVHFIFDKYFQVALVIKINEIKLLVQVV